MTAPPNVTLGGAQVIGVVVQTSAGVQIVSAVGQQTPLLAAPTTSATFQPTTTNLQWKRAALTVVAVIVLAAVAVLGAYTLGIQPVKNWLEPYLANFSFAGMVKNLPKGNVQQSCTGASYLLPIDRAGMTMPTAAQATPGTILQISDVVEWTTRFGGAENTDAKTLLSSLAALMPEQETLDWVSALEKALNESFATGCFKFPFFGDVLANLATAEKSVVPPAAIMPAGEHFVFPSAPVGVVDPTATPVPTATQTAFEQQQATLANACVANSKNKDLCQIIGTNLLVTGSGLDAAVKEAVASTSSETCYELVEESTDWAALTSPGGKVREAMGRQSANFLQVWGDQNGYHAVSERDGNGVYKVCAPNLTGVPNAVPDGRPWGTANGSVVSDYPFLPFGQTWLGGSISFFGPGPVWEFNGGEYGWVCGEDKVCVFPVYTGPILPPTATPNPVIPDSVLNNMLVTPDLTVTRITWAELPQVMKDNKFDRVTSSRCDANGRPFGWPNAVAFQQLPTYVVDLTQVADRYSANCGSGEDIKEWQLAVFLGNQPPIQFQDLLNWACTLEICYRPFQP